MRSPRFQPLRNPSLRRLKTAFGSSSNSSTPTLLPAPSLPEHSPTSTVSMEDLSPGQSTPPPSRGMFSSPASGSSSRCCSPHSAVSTGSNFSVSAARLRALLMLRRKRSTLEDELEEEREMFGVELEMLEPRPPVSGVVAGGIFEVLDGRL